ncbi:lysine--tRNA ligase [Candidatus Marithrix sp. Canyon 246]|uniref:lysine--tRNA ligase n=1 Tax=Candidatus Marithrix sp. Canyon 246 TaxID=1827136 RepID=UPI00084A24FC|nr:lysine--tRNA ligase [Candidatus Marithrix sp. Canyon 246]
MSKVTWPHQEAKRLRGIASNSDKAIIFETGYGPSGLPHIGTFAEVARTTFVIKALKEAFPEVKIRLIAFSDDMDGLRSLPENIPNHDTLAKFLGMPLSSIPDPFEQASSFADYMNGQLKQFLNTYGFEYEFYSSTQCYKDGIFDQGLKKIMDNYTQIRELFIATISKDKREAWSPFFPICESCGKIYTTRVVNVDPENYSLTYKCDQDNFESCGHEATTMITGGKVKVGWKIDWALRWATFGVNYEMYGKDLMSSASMAGKICTILGGKPPVNYKYELFLDEKGAKISKKIGNGISMEQWMKYSPVGALLNFLLANPNKARQMGLPILPKIVDEYIDTLRKPQNNINHNLWFINSIQHEYEVSNLDKNEISYNLLSNVAQNLGIRDASLLYKYALKYDSTVADNADFFRLLCEKVVAYVEDYEAQIVTEPLEIDKSYSTYLPELIEIIDHTDNFDALAGEDIQALAFIIPKKYDLNKSQWFKFLYSVLLGKEKGPRLGPFLGILGKESVLSMLRKSLK